MTALAAGIASWGSAHGIEYYNLTQIDPETLVQDAATFNRADITSTLPGATAIFTTDPSLYPTGLNNIVGTGVLNPFLRIHKPNANCGNAPAPCTEFGYNTSGDSSQPQFAGTKDKEGHNWNYTLELDSIPVVTVGTTDYRAFILDINESNAGGTKNYLDKFLSLDQFRLFTSEEGNLDEYSCGGIDKDCTSAGVYSGGGSTTYNPLLHTFTDAESNAGNTTKIFDLDSGAEANCVPNESPLPTHLDSLSTGGVCDRTLGLNYALNSGSGNGVDLVVYVPDSLFAQDQKFVYLFSSFGELGQNADHTGNSDTNKPASTLPPGDFGQSAGFEEWSTLRHHGNPISPTLALMLIGLLAMSGATKLRSLPRFA